MRTPNEVLGPCDCRCCYQHRQEQVEIRERQALILRACSYSDIETETAYSDAIALLEGNKKINSDK